MLQAGQRPLWDGAAPGRPSHSVPARESGIIYRFDQIEVDPRLGCLKREGQEQHLRQQSFHLLLYMVERRDRLISKEELVENFWQGSAVTDNAVVQCIKEIRKVLGDDPHVPRFIKTIHKSGYRFIAPVVAVPVHEETPCDPPALDVQA